MRHATGVRVLLAPTRPDQASSVTVELIRDVYALLRSTFDAVIVDTPPGFTAEVIATIDAASDLVIVGMLDALSLKNTKLGLETLELMGCEPDMITLVLNRAQSQVGISQNDVANVLGREPDILIPSDREIPRAVNEGVPITPGQTVIGDRGGFPPARDVALRKAESSSGSAASNGSDTSHARRRLFGRKT